MTAKEIAAQIEHALSDLNQFVFKSKQGMKLGGEDSVMVSFANVPAGSSELDCLNSKKQIMIHVVSAPGKKWVVDGQAPDKIAAEAFRGRGITMKRKTGSPEKVIEHIVKAFVAGGPY